MKKLLYLTTLVCIGLFGFTFAQVESMNVAPATQTAISGSTITFLVTGHNGTGDAYLKYVLPKTANYDVIYQNATLTPINNALLSLGAEHDPVFYLPADSDFSVTVTAKMTTNVWTFSTLTTQAIFSDSTAFTTLLGAVNALITPIADLVVTNVLTGENPSYSGDNVYYYITLQNIGSTAATGINFVSTFPIPTLAAPTATFNGTPHAYDSISYPTDFVRSGSYLNNLNPGQTIIIAMNAPMTQNFAVGTTFNQTAKVSTVNDEYSTTNNSALATGSVQSLADVRIIKTLAPFTGYRAGDEVRYTITYGNSGGKTAENVTITDTMNGQVSLNGNNFTIGSLPGGSGGTIILTGSLNSNLFSGIVFVNTAEITTTNNESSTGNNISVATGTIQGVKDLDITLIINNITRPQLDNAPYGSGPTTMIQAASGDVLYITMTYTNNGNIPITHAVLHLTGINANFSTLNPFNGTIPNIIDIDESATLIVTGVVGPRNYISLAITPYIRHDVGEIETGNTVTVIEPLVCGDGLLTRDEPCDTQGQLGVLYSGQTCENQQGQCILVTNSIINVACINYSFADPLGGGRIVEQQLCSTVNTALTNASCTSLTGSAPEATNNGYTINYTCKGANATSTTPITIDCGNGTNISGFGSQLNGTCSYASSFAGTAQCSVGSDTNNPLCRLAVNETQLQCDLEALDGRIILVDDDNEGEGRFRCETRDGVIADIISIDCGNRGEGDATANNTSQVETVCRYSENTLPQDKIVTCYTNDVECETENIIIDNPTLGYCGDGIVEGYEDCDDGDLNGTSSSSCTIGCDIRDADMVSCFNVGNMNISIEKGDQLPFRWMLDGSENIIAGSSCEGKPDGKIPVETMYCTFSIYNGDRTESEGNPIYSFTKKCNENNWNGMMFDYFLGQQNLIGSLKHAFGKYSIDSNNFVNNIFGEYKIVLERVEYDYCRSDEREESTAIDRVCSVNFTVTQPYLAQKSLFAMTPKATDIRLDDYMTLDGQELIRTTDLNEIMVLDESDYNGGNDVNDMINDFITKYDRLAITVPESSLKNTAFEEKDVTVKIVPQQKIYILESDTQKEVILTNIKSFTAPFTIVTKNIDLVIKGNVDYNGMFLVKNGTIEFIPAEVSGNDRCPAPQVVKGIFITDEGFVGTDPALKNNNTDKKRCTYGNLHVKGILIGDGIDDLVNSRRSQLNTRFYTRSSAEIAIKSERRNKIFDGAAVLIEYSPNLWNALPPGASEFTKVLEVYKQ